MRPDEAGDSVKIEDDPVKVKSFKDPIYGYVEIRDSFVKEIVNTPEFQRLRRIVQTSYGPLYPSATHNRFVHSLGVYYLGRLVTECIRTGNQIKDLGFGEDEESYNRYLDVFEVACLLHDVGHAPFSHTGEGFYKTPDGKTENLHIRIAELLGDEEFKRFGVRKKTAAPHELMSVIIGLKTFGSRLECLDTKDKREFFARAITGYKYECDDDLQTNEDGVNLTFLDCLVSLLNSSIVDVDRLDYLIRDASCTGFESVLIDYRRLLGGVRIKKARNEGCFVAYSKQSVSVLENVVFAHDAERKWIQKHPVIGYETQLIQDAIDDVTATHSKVFCEESLGADGVEVSQGFRVRYLCDDDVVFLMKNTDSNACRLFFDRGSRYHPLWKSDTEFYSLFRDWPPELMDDFMTFYQLFGKCIQKSTSTPHRVNKDTLVCLTAEADEAQRKAAEIEDSISRVRQTRQAESKALYRDLAAVFKVFAEDVHLEFDFELIGNSSFSSNFGKEDLRNTKIDLPCEADTVELFRLTKLLAEDGTNASRFPKDTFYVFCRRDDDFDAKNARKLVMALQAFAESKKDGIKTLILASKREKAKSEVQP